MLLEAEGLGGLHPADLAVSSANDGGAQPQLNLSPRVQMEPVAAEENGYPADDLARELQPNEDEVVGFDQVRVSFGWLCNN